MPRFRGTINLNGGGFSSFRKSFSTDLSSYSGLWVEADVITDSAFHTPLAIHVQLGASEPGKTNHKSRWIVESFLSQGDDSRWSFGAAFAIPYGPAGATYGTYLPFEWFTKQLRWTCSGCAAWRATSWRLQ